MWKEYTLYHQNSFWRASRDPCERRAHTYRHQNFHLQKSFQDAGERAHALITYHHQKKQVCFWRAFGESEEGEELHSTREEDFLFLTKGLTCIQCNPFCWQLLLYRYRARSETTLFHNPRGCRKELRPPLRKEQGTWLRCRESRLRRQRDSILWNLPPYRQLHTVSAGVVRDDDDDDEKEQQRHPHGNFELSSKSLSQSPSFPPHFYSSSALPIPPSPSGEGKPRATAPRRHSRRLSPRRNLFFRCVPWVLGHGRICC